MRYTCSALSHVSPLTRAFEQAVLATHNAIIAGSGAIHSGVSHSSGQSAHQQCAPLGFACVVAGGECGWPLLSRPCQADTAAVSRASGRSFITDVMAAAACVHVCCLTTLVGCDV